MHVELAQQDEVPPLEGAELPPMEAHHANPTTGEDEFALETANAGGNGRGGGQAAAGAQSGRCGGQPGRSFDLGQGAAQRALPVRLRQEIQALPRHLS